MNLNHSNRSDWIRARGAVLVGVAALHCGCLPSERPWTATLARRSAGADDASPLARQDAAVLPPPASVAPAETSPIVDASPSCYAVDAPENSELRCYFSIGSGGGFTNPWFSMLLVERSSSQECVTRLNTRCEQASIDTEGVAHCDGQSFSMTLSEEGVLVTSSRGQRLRVSHLRRQMPPGTRVVLGW
jgi:hypothetical protein